MKARQPTAISRVTSCSSVVYLGEVSDGRVCKPCWILDMEERGGMGGQLRSLKALSFAADMLRTDEPMPIICFNICEAFRWCFARE